MKRILILVCCLLVAFAAYAVENSAVIAGNGATKGATLSPADEMSVLQAEILQLKAARASDAQVSALEKRLTALTEARGNVRNSLDACNTCTTSNTLDPVPTTVWLGSVSGDCGTEGKWLASFTGVAGTVYHFDLCTIGSSTFDSDIKICNSLCAILTGVDGSSSCNWNASDFQWTCATAGTYYVVIAPYRSYNQHNCIGTSSNTFTLRYYAAGATPPPANDACAGAIDVGTLPASIAVDNTNATDDGLGTTCGPLPYGPVMKGMWYKFVGAGEFIYTASTCNAVGTLYDTEMQVFSGTCSNLVCVGANDDDDACSSGSRSTVSWCGAAGVTYYIHVGAYSTNKGTFQLDVSEGASCSIQFDCNTLTACGTPVEVEPNDACPPPANQTMLGCVGFGCPDVTPVIYGMQCPASDLDFWAVCVPALSKMTITPYQGVNCDVTPVTYRCQFYFGDCATALGSAFSGAFVLTNSGTAPAIIFLKVYNAGGIPVPTPVAYKLTAECCALEYLCASAIPMGNETSFHTVINTCPVNPCGSVPAGIYSTGCGLGTQWAAGPSRFFTFTLSHPSTNLNIIITGGDLQMMLFTDCANPYGTCVASVDNGTYANGEAFTGLALPIGTYYLSVSFYGTSTCGDITVDVTSDVELPVTMGDVSIVPMDNAVALRWTTQSETHLDKWIVKRDNVAVYQVNATNSASLHTYSFTDLNAVNGRTYSYDLVVRDANGSESVVRTLSATPAIGAGVVDAYALHQNYPNPFNPTTDIIYDVKSAGLVTLKVYNMMGQEVTTLVNAERAQGRYTVSFNATNLPSGLYLCKMTAGSYTSQIKMLLMK